MWIDSRPIQDPLQFGLELRGQEVLDIFGISMNMIDRQPQALREIDFP